MLLVDVGTPGFAAHGDGAHDVRLAVEVGIEDHGAAQVACPGSVIALQAARGVEDGHAVEHAALRLQDVAGEGGWIGGDDRGCTEIFGVTGVRGDAFHAERLTGMPGAVQSRCLCSRS